MNGTIYYIACKETHRLKIGYTSRSVKRRIAALQTGSASPLVFMAMHPGTMETERRIHERFADERLHGEWFEMSENLFRHMVHVIMWQAEQYVERKEQPPEWIAIALFTLEALLCDDEEETVQ